MLVKVNLLSDTCNRMQQSGYDELGPRQAKGKRMQRKAGGKEQGEGAMRSRVERQVCMALRLNQTSTQDVTFVAFVVNDMARSICITLQHWLTAAWPRRLFACAAHVVCLCVSR
jgi:hypothetical protein